MYFKFMKEMSMLWRKSILLSLLANPVGDNMSNRASKFVTSPHVCLDAG